jgi:[ribosomal protein S18]-alanine N-acetyltransferase
VVLREYRDGDFEGLVVLDRSCFEPGIAYSAAEMQRYLSLATREAIVAESEGEIVGFCLGYRAPHDIGRIITLDVRSDCRRSGLGRELLTSTILRLASAGARETVLEVDERNQGAIAFYEELGFRPRGRIPNYYGPGRPALKMAREVR